MTNLTNRQKWQLRRAERLQRLVNREGNGLRVAVFEIPVQYGDDTPDDIDVDRTPSDIDTDEGKDEEGEEHG